MLSSNKGQSDIMNYVILTFFIMVIIAALIIFITFWQVSQISQQRVRGETGNVLNLMKEVLNSPYFVKEDSIFDDSKLMALVLLDKCDELEDIFGEDMFIKVKVLPGDYECITSNDYPGCNYWEFCADSGNYTSYIIPVNVYRVIGYDLASGVLGRTDAGTLEVGIYHA